MKKLIVFLMSGILLAGTVACQQEAAKTGPETPGAANENTKAPVKEASQTSQTSNKAVTTSKSSANDLISAVSKHLKEKLPGSKLEVEGQDGAITVKGTVPSPAELKKVVPLAKEVKGVKTVKVEAKVEPTKKANN
jgi:osmotically-inducible protein OsmY